MEAKSEHKNIVITGAGAITPIGNSVEEYWKNLTEGLKSGVGRITRFETGELPVKIAAEVKDFDPLLYMTKKKTKEMDLFMQYGYAAAMQAIEEAKLSAAAPERIGISVGTALGGISPIAATQAELSSGEKKKVGPRFVTQVIGNELAAHIAIEKGYRGPSMTVTTACSSGGDAISLACMMLRAGMADSVVAVGTESALAPVFILGLSSAHALSTRNEEPEKASRPFDRDRDGFVIGEGGGALVLETEEHATERGAKILGRIAGFSNCTDGYHVTSPDPNGVGAIFCMKQALADSGLSPQEIGYINTHGTSTPVGDVIEAAAIDTVFAGCQSDVLISSTKGATGHMMGAGGITEVITCLRSVQTGIIPPTLNLAVPDEKLPKLHLVAEKPEKREIKAAMSNSFGFGGQNSSVIVTAF